MPELPLGRTAAAVAGEARLAPVSSPSAVDDAAAPRRHPGTRCGWLLAIGLFAGVCAVHLVYPAGNTGRATYLMATVGAAVMAWTGARRRAPRWRFAWSCIAAAVVLSAVGDVIYEVLSVQALLSDVTVADGLWLASYLAMAIGLSGLSVGFRGWSRLDIDGLIDIGCYCVLAVLAATQLPVVRDLMSDTTYPVFVRSVWTSYPILDAAVLAVVIQAMVRGRLRGRSGALLGCGALLWLIADLITLITIEDEVALALLDLAWMLGAGMIAAAIWTAPPATARDEDLVIGRVTDARMVITLLPLLVPGAIEIYEFANGRDPNPVPLFAAVVVLLLLAFARSARLVSARNDQEAELERSTHFYAALAENSADAVIVVDADGHILNNSPNLATMLGRSGVSTVGMDAFAMLRPTDRAKARAVFDRWWSTTGVVADAEIRTTGLDGSARWLGLRAANLSDDEIVAGMVINLSDVTERRQAEEELSHSAFHDSLTGLANRALFHDRLEHALERTARSGYSVAVIYLDLDGFKIVNDTRGHEAGDRVLTTVAGRVTSIVRSPDTVARLGGDEFAILIEESTDALGEAETVAKRILAALSEPFALGDQQFFLTASIGISTGDNTSTTSSMLRDADVAMYKAKTTGKARWTVYEPAMRAAALQRLQLESDLYRALTEDQLRLVYQPVIELSSGGVVGFEALLRWQHPTLGSIEPTAFIPLAEDNGTIVEIGRWVLHEACATAARWQRAYPQLALSMAVNVSARQIATPDLVDHVSDALGRTGLNPTSLTLEMTETVLVQDPVTARRRLEQLRALGVRLAIDDFGTGYSSLSYLRQFPIDVLKMDKSFTDTITDRDRAPAIVQGVLDLAKTLRMATVAEGIELEVQHTTLRDQRCEFGQGFLFSRPLELQQATTLLDRHQQELAAAGVEGGSGRPAVGPVTRDGPATRRPRHEPTDVGGAADR